MNDTKVGLAVAAARNASHMSQDDLGKMMNTRGFAWHQTTVVRVETGVRPLRYTESRAVEAILHFHIGEPVHVVPMLAGIDAAIHQLQQYRKAFSDES